MRVEAWPKLDLIFGIGTHDNKNVATKMHPRPVQWKMLKATWILLSHISLILMRLLLSRISLILEDISSTGSIQVTAL
jgi:hypothetical protein